MSRKRTYVPLSDVHWSSWDTVKSTLSRVCNLSSYAIPPQKLPMNSNTGCHYVNTVMLGVTNTGERFGNGHQIKVFHCSHSETPSRGRLMMCKSHIKEETELRSWRKKLTLLPIYQTPPGFPSLPSRPLDQSTQSPVPASLILLPQCPYTLILP